MGLHWIRPGQIVNMNSPTQIVVKSKPKVNANNDTFDYAMAA